MWAKYNRDYRRRWGGESGWEEREEIEDGGCLHGSGDIGSKAASGGVILICDFLMLRLCDGMYGSESSIKCFYIVYSPCDSKSTCYYNERKG